MAYCTWIYNACNSISKDAWWDRHTERKGKGLIWFMELQKRIKGYISKGKKSKSAKRIKAYISKGKRNGE